MRSGWAAEWPRLRPKGPPRRAAACPAFFSFHSMLLWPLRPGPSGHLLGQSCPHPHPTPSRTRQQLDTAPSSPHSGPGLSPPGCSGPSTVHTVPFVKTLPLVSQGDRQNLDKRVGPTRRTARPVSVTWSAFTLEKTHLCPSPLSLRWAFSGDGSSPHAECRPLQHLTA